MAARALAPLPMDRVPLGAAFMVLFRLLVVGSGYV